MQLPEYSIAAYDSLPTPAVLVFRELLECNLDRMIELVGSPERLRPHCKTHKTREIIQLLLARGITRHKAATLREVAMCLEAGARDVVLAYSLVGPSVGQFVDLVAQTPDARLAALVDCETHIDLLAAAARSRGITVGAMLDLNTGFHRTGAPLEAATKLYARLTETSGLRPAGLHVYDAQNGRHADPDARREAVAQTIRPVLEVAEALVAAGLDVPEILCGGSPTFPAYAAFASGSSLDHRIICSPGTAIFSDFGYGETYPDLGAAFAPAAVVLGRVISRPTPQHVTLDIGSKAIAADPPFGMRGLILGLEDAQTTVHNEEHWTVTSQHADRFRVGDPVLVVPTHICPCTNLHPVLYIIGPDGQIEGRWEVAARHRTLVL